VNEIVALLVLAFAGGVAVAGLTKIPNPESMLLGPILGVSGFVGVGSLMVILMGTVRPWWCVAVVAAGGLGVVILRFRKLVEGGSLLATAGSLAITSGVAALARLTHPTRMTVDSARYLLGADILLEPDAVERFRGADLLKRGLTTALGQTLGSLDGALYSEIVIPLVAVAGVLLLAALTRRICLHLGTTEVTAVVLGVLAAAFVFASNRGLFDVFYINSHGMVMTAMLVMVACSYLARVTAQPSWLLPVAVAAPPMIVARAEGPLLVAITLLPMLVDTTIRLGHRLATILPTTVLSTLWYAVGIWELALGERTDPTDPVTAGLIAGVLLAVVTLVAVPATERLVRWVPALALIGLAALLGIYALGDIDGLVETASATAANLVFEGAWGFTWLALIPLVVAAMVNGAFEHERFFVVPIVGFGLLFFLMPFLRQDPYRVGTGDSGNRVMAHILLVAVAFALTAVVGSRPVPGRRVRGRAA
jgi:hypothetical protein